MIFYTFKFKKFEAYGFVNASTYNRVDYMDFLLG